MVWKCGTTKIESKTTHENSLQIIHYYHYSYFCIDGCLGGRGGSWGWDEKKFGAKCIWNCLWCTSSSSSWSSFVSTFVFVASRSFWTHFEAGIMLCISFSKKIKTSKHTIVLSFSKLNTVRKCGSEGIDWMGEGNEISGREILLRFSVVITSINFSLRSENYGSRRVRILWGGDGKVSS